MIHHDGKSDSSRIKGGRGASSIGDWAPNIIALAAVSKEPHIIKVMHVKGRDFAPFDDFTLRRTEQFDFERYAGKVKESERKEAVIKDEKVRVVEDEILQFLGQGKADQKTIIERICQIFEKDKISPQKARKILERMMVERKIKSRREGKRKLYYLRKGGKTLSKGKMAEIINIFARRKLVAKNNP